MKVLSPEVLSLVRGMEVVSIRGPQTPGWSVSVEGISQALLGKCVKGFAGE